MLVRALEVSDIIIINFGLHCNPCNSSYFKNLLGKIATVLKEHIIQHPDKQVIFRNTLPQHFKNNHKSEDGYFQAFNESGNCSGKANWTNDHMKQICKTYGFKYLDSIPLYAERWDMHRSWNKPPDCTHFCYMPEVTIPEIALLDRLVTS